MYRLTGYAPIARPIVGVYLGSGSIPLSDYNRIYRLKRLLEANKTAGITLMFFAEDDVDFYKGQIDGACYDEDEQRWSKRTFPFPDVLYVRGGGDGTEELLAKFDSLGIKRINPIHAFNKGELLELLKQDKAVLAHLPPTVTVEKSNDIKNAILKFGKVYVKACRGRKGLQVMRIEKLPEKNGYLYSYSTLGKLVRRKVSHMDRLQSSIGQFFGDKKVIVQRAIDLVTTKGNRLVDFRAEVQRNKDGEIEIVGISARVGRPDSPITTHSSAYRYDDYLPKLFPRYSDKQLNALKTDIQEFLRNVYMAVEKKYGRFGEIGIDFAVDTKGKLWLIECNSQSAKVSFVKAYGSKAQRAYLNPLEYAKAIAGRSRTPSSDRSRSYSSYRSRYRSRSGYKSSQNRYG